MQDPTPDEIRRMCLEIQATWTDFQRAWRAGLIRPEPRGWHFANGEARYYEVEFCWTVPQYLVHHGEIGRSEERRYRELRVWDRVG